MRLAHLCVLPYILISTLLVAGCGSASSHPAAAPTAAPAVAVATATITPVSAAPTAAPTAAAFPVTVKDSLMRDVSIPAKPQRIVSLSPGNTEILYALGLGDNVVGVTTYCDYPPEATAKDKVGGFSKIDLEKVIALNPDLVLAANIHEKTVVPELERRGIRVLTTDAASIDEVLGGIATVGKATGQTAQAGQLNAAMRKRVEAVAAKTQSAPKVKTFWMLHDSLWTGGNLSFSHDLISKAGGENIAGDSAQQYFEYNLESLVAKNPDVIITDSSDPKTVDAIKAKPGWQNLGAVKSGRVYNVADTNVMARPGPRIVDALEFVAKTLHPELYK